jgi:hypothetical protein
MQNVRDGNILAATRWAQTVPMPSALLIARAKVTMTSVVMGMYSSTQRDRRTCCVAPESSRNAPPGSTSLGSMS